MRLIPTEHFAEVEFRLHRRKTARAEAERLIAEAMSDAVSLTGPLGHESGGGKGQPGDPTGRGAERVLRAREKAETVERWERIFRRTEEDFPPGSDEHKAASLFYDGGLTLDQIGRIMHYERQTIRRKRDAFVYRAAWYAAEDGLTRE
ncbi:MAG: hypothetical protein IKS31_04955 [Clostridia bacterium]|nr:hypothetical protein [Clostridia bacterium]